MFAAHGKDFFAVQRLTATTIFPVVTLTDPSQNQVHIYVYICKESQRGRGREEVPRGREREV
jgi:hypothetical protein